LNLHKIWKFLVIITLLSLLVACSSGSSEESKGRVDGFYYSFDEIGITGNVIYSGRVTDYSGNNFHGQAVSIGKVHGKIGSGATFGFAEDASIILEEISNYFPYETGFTFRAWLLTGNYPNKVQQIIGSTLNREPGSDGDGFGIAISGSRIIFELPEDPDFFQSTSPDLSFPPATWFHIAVTYDGENLSYFYNGDLVATDTVVTNFKSGFYNHIGSNKDATSNGHSRTQFLETIDEIYLENRVMSSQEIMNYYLDTL